MSSMVLLVQSLRCGVGCWEKDGQMPRLSREPQSSRPSAVRDASSWSSSTYVDDFCVPAAGVALTVLIFSLHVEPWHFVGGRMMTIYFLEIHLQLTLSDGKSIRDAPLYTFVGSFK